MKSSKLLLKYIGYISLTVIGSVCLFATSFIISANILIVSSDGGSLGEGLGIMFGSAFISFSLVFTFLYQILKSVARKLILVIFLFLLFMSLMFIWDIIKEPMNFSPLFLLFIISPFVLGYGLGSLFNSLIMKRIKSF